MSLLYKILLFLWLFYLISMFVHALNIFPYTPFSTPFSDIGNDPFYAMVTNQHTTSTSILDYFYHYDADLRGVGLGTIHFTSLTIISIFFGAGLLITILKADIRPLIIGLTFGALLSMLNSSITFMNKIILGNGAGTATIILVGILGASVLFIFGITAAEKIISGGNELND
jgi:hypothetical protein